MYQELIRKASPWYDSGMKISFNQTSGPNVRDTNGYGYAANMCKDTLRDLGHEVTWRDPTADVEMNFIQPDNWYWSGVDYRIAYLPWESTEFRPGWVDALNSVDEVWTPAPRVAEWMVDAGVKKDIRIYQHGVDAIWAPVSRSTTDRYHVLHHGAEALRKGGNETIRAFTNTLWDEEATLVMKMLLDQFNVHDTEHIKILKTKVPIEELVAIYHSCHLLSYPSYGEGFGLAPLQAMGTGMPVLVTDGWAPYQYLLPPEMVIESELRESPWPHHHPGKVYHPNVDDLQDKMRYAFDNREWFAQKAWEYADQVHKDYNWKNLTRDAFAHLV